MANSNKRMSVRQIDIPSRLFIRKFPSFIVRLPISIKTAMCIPFRFTTRRMPQLFPTLRRVHRCRWRTYGLLRAVTLSNGRSCATQREEKTGKRGAMPGAIFRRRRRESMRTPRRIAFCDAIKLVRSARKQQGRSNGPITPVIWNETKERIAVERWQSRRFARIIKIASRHGDNVNRLRARLG